MQERTQSAIQESAGDHSQKLKLIIHLGFVFTGIVTTLLGPILPSLVLRWSLNDAQAGYLFTAQFTGSLLGTLLTSVSSGKDNPRTWIAAGHAVMAMGVGALLLGGRIIGLIATMLFGAGQGTAITLSNVYISNLNPERRAAALNVLNLAWGFGAVACPLLAGFALRHNRLPVFLGFVVAGLATTAMVLGIIRSSAASAQCPRISAAAVGAWSRKQATIVGALFFLYVGTETSVGGWAAAYAKRITAAPQAMWVAAPSVFWAALMVGRSVAPVVLQRLSGAQMARFGLVVAAVGISLMISSTGVLPVLAGLALAGLGLASVFPITVASLSHFGQWAGRVAGPMFAISSVGGAIIPWAVGLVSAKTGGLRQGMLIPLFCMLAMLSIYAWGMRPHVDTSIVQPS